MKSYALNADKKRVLVAMSGGVDSSVVAALLKEQGYDVVGVTMQVWDYSQPSCEVEEGSGTCCASQDVEDARAVADILNIPFYVVNCESQFRATVIDNFIESYLKGETPIPCVNCNTYLKFDHLLTKMRELNCDYLATGHYAQVQRGEDNLNRIYRSSDDWKDQTYFLFTLKPEILSRIMFPIGRWQKSDLRSYAEKAGLPVAKKRDSTGICFVGKEGYAGFVEREAGIKAKAKGVIRSLKTGEVMAEHQGIHHFTIGQRKGLGVATGTPMYVVKLEASSQTVWLGGEEDLLSDTLVVRDINFLDKIADGETLQVKIRYAHRGAQAQITFLEGSKARLQFTEKQRAITSGQAAVFYRGDQLVGGGWIL
jgi:tRNA-specific 2-thiouridylase